MSIGAMGEKSPPRASLDTVLAYAWDADVFTAGDAMPETGLTRSTTIDAIDELIRHGLLRELPNARAVGEYRKGRPSRRFELRSDAAVVIGMDAGRAHLTTTVADLRGRTIVRESIELDVAHDAAEDRRIAVVAAVDAALAAAEHSRDQVLAICVGVPAPVDAAGASPPHRDDFWRRMNPDLGALLAEWAPIVRIENDASLAAVAEGSVGAAVGCRDYVALLAGERFGAGIVMDGRLLRGAHGGAGETVAFDHVEGVGTAEGIGSLVRGWARDAIVAGDIAPEHPLAQIPSEQLSARAVLARAASGDRAIDAIVQRAGVLFARVAGVFGSLYDPARIVVSGAVAVGLEEVLAIARANVADELDLPAPDLVASTLGAEVVSIGAVSAAIEAARANVLVLSRTVRT